MPETKPGGARATLLRPALWFLIYGALLAGGLYAWHKIPVEVLPRFDFPQISVIAHEPGASALELETQIVQPLEGRILALPDLAGVRSTMGDGTVETDVRFRQGTNAQMDLQAVNGAVDLARGDLPPTVHPLAQIMGNSINEVADYAVQIPPSLPTAEIQRDILADVVPALRALSGVQIVNLYGAGAEALWVQPDLTALRRYGVSAAALVSALKSQVLLTPGGYLTQGHQDIFIEVRNLPLRAAQVRRIAVQGPGGPIPLGALARVARAAVPTLNAVLLDGRPALEMNVFKQPGASTVPVTRAVQAALAATHSELPAGVRWIRAYNQGHLVGAVGKDLGLNLAIGGLLAIGVLLWVLGGSRDTWVLALSIPMSLLMGVAGLYFSGQGLDLMTLGALTVAVGLLADDGIIVLESIHHRWEEGDGHWEGIWRGLKDIAGPDATGTLTTISVFIPLLFMGGLAGLFFTPFALAMTFSLLASLLVSLSLIPLSLGLIKGARRAKPAQSARLLARLRGLNEKVFEHILMRPKAALAACLALFLASVAAMAWVSVNFLPLPNEGVLLESYTLPPGTSLADTEAAVAEITKRLKKDPDVLHVLARIGSASGTAYTEPAYAGEMEIVLKPGVNVNSLDAIGARVLKESRMTGVQSALDTPTIERVGESLSGLSQPFVLDIFGNDIAQLRRLSDEFTARLRRIPSLTSIFNNAAYPVSQILIEPAANALDAYGLTPAGLRSQIGPLIDGAVAARVPEGNVPLDLYVRLAGAPGMSVADLKRLPIRTAGGWTPLGQLARVRLTSTPNQLIHVDGARALEILATPTGPLGGTIAAARRALSGVVLPAGYRYSFGGLYKELEKAALGLGIAALAAFALMIGIMILQFDGLLAPGLLLLLTPLAFTGGAIALAASGVGLNAAGLIAFLTLVGIGLNHGIVLLYRAGKNEAAGMETEAAVREAVGVRFRPIVLTTLTAVLGMLPTALGFGQGAAPEQGLAIVTLGGVVWSALLSTNLIPALYVRLRRRQSRKAAQ
ncbi:MAG TPA: efflux RND transporter permease subunit [Elusimicrobiota bacterium]|nr:efflux RND transporter permease subunit [Elusimicrobiota bacterium]